MLVALSTMSFGAGATASNAVVSPRLEHALIDAESVYVVVKLAPPVAKDVAAGKESWRSVRARSEIALAQDRAEAVLPVSEWRRAYRFRSLPYMTGWATEKGVRALASSPDVAAISLDERIRANVAEALPFMNWDKAGQKYGFKGAGLAVAVFDTGIDPNSDDFSGRVVVGGRFHLANTSQPNDNNINDGHGHGTNVAGIIASGGAIAGEGVAPEADVVVYKVLDNQGAGMSSDWCYAMDHAVNTDVGDLVVANLSLGTDAKFSECPCGDPQVAWQGMVIDAIANLHDAGIAVFAASGNDALRGQMAMPACAGKAISVGAVYDDGPYPPGVGFQSCSDLNIQPDRPTCFTNMNNCLDMLSVGADVISSVPGNGPLVGMYGTSQASPGAAGAALLLYEQKPNRTPDEVKALLLDSGAPIDLSPDWNAVVPRLDILAALDDGDDVGGCGDGVVDPGEACDDGVDNGSLCCDVNCQLVPNGETCDDGSACTSDTACQEGVCEGGTPLDCSGLDGACVTGDCEPATGCVATPVQNGSPCDDGEFCTVDDGCTDGACTAGQPRDCSDAGAPCAPGECDEAANECVANNAGGAEACDDDNPCTQDICDPAEGCDYKKLTGTPCDDESDCTEDDSCGFGVCQGNGIDCSDANPCTNDACNPATGCINEPNSELCTDNNACTQGDECIDGFCIAGQPLVCDDGNPCTNDSCFPANGCIHTANDELCDDGEDCTYGDQCFSSACVSGQLLNCDDNNSCTDDVCHPIFGCTFEADNNNNCTDDSECTVNDNCQDGMCVYVSDLNCDDGNVCTDDSCTEEFGCINAANEALCNDGDYCTIGDKCGGGTCLAGGLALNCNDGNQCTLDVCVPNKGCVNNQTGGVCNDGNACTKNDVCAGSVCVPGAFLDCSDNNPCTVETCDVNTGCKFSYAQETCSDGNICTVGDNCQSGNCVGKSIFDCDDGNPCTDDSCQPVSGCIHVPNAIPCSDGDTCTIGDTCIQGFCKSSETLDCDDGNVCTLDICDKVTGCVFQAIPGFCDDLNECTSDDQCLGGACVGVGTLKCDDNNSCTLDTCEPNGGCSNKPLETTCNDGNPCTLNDLCFAGECQAGTDMNCSDGNPCTDDSCDVTGTCVHAPNESACSDGNACTLGDLCVEGKCSSTGMADCDDGNQCTADWCDVLTGCLHEPKEGPCEDGNLCTLGDTCINAFCSGSGGAINCDDGNLCTVDVCDPQVGCSFQDAIGDCDDSNGCTVNDVCSKGKCLGVAADCDDNSVCTDDSCTPLEGCIHTTNTKKCNDGDACTNFDECLDGACLGEPISCSDGNECTEDVCDFVVGCVHQISLKNCSDGNVCTVNDQCKDGQCSGKVIPCDDNNPCTTDTCDTALGCTFTPNQEICNDGNACTDKDACGFGQCKGEPVICYDANACTDDGCDTNTGCFHNANFDICDDGNACTLGDHCDDGICVGDVLNCDDDNPCTDDVCLTGAGCTHVFNTSLCDDGQFCTIGESCWQGLCGGGETRDCSAFDKLCEASICSEEDNTCILVARENGSPCEDGLFCTVEDACSDGTCAPGTLRDCTAWDGEETVGVCKEPESRCAAVPRENPPPTDPPDEADAGPSPDISEDIGGQSPVIVVGTIGGDGAGQVSDGCAASKTETPYPWIVVLLVGWFVVIRRKRQEA